MSLVLKALHDSLATFDVAGGVLLVAIWFQTGYVALFRAIHGPDEPAPVPARAIAARRTASSQISPW
jgi:hypothetical protein